MTNVIGWFHKVAEWMSKRRSTIRNGATTYCVGRDGFVAENYRLVMDLSVADAQTVWDDELGSLSLS